MITIVPTDNLVILSGNPATGVSMDGVDPNIHAIQFNEATGKGWIEYEADEETGVIPPVEPITSLETWAAQVSEAETILFCAENPKTFYRTGSAIGKPILVGEKGWPQPPETTEQVPPPSPAEGTSLYWDGTSFVWSAYPIDLTLEDAKVYLTDAVNARAYALLQPSDWMVARQAETGTPIPDEWGTWRQLIRDQASEKRTAIDGASSLPELRDYSLSSAYLAWAEAPAA